MIRTLALCLFASPIAAETVCIPRADLIATLATQLAERDARIAALTEALRTIHTRAISTRGDQAYREFPRFAEKASRAALTTDKEPKT